MCDCCERRLVGPLVQVLVRRIDGSYKWFSMCAQCVETLRRESENE